MRINDANVEYLKSDLLKPSPNGTDVGAKQALEATAPADWADKVLISDLSRALSAQEGGSTDLNPQRVAEIREKILSGAYDSLDAVDQLARRIIQSGDL